MSRLLLMRHGQSTWNAEGRWQGQADPPLSEMGAAQAEAVAARLEHVDAVWASDLERAHHTARILAAPHGHAVATDARLREREAGPFTGLTRDEIEARFPGYLADGRRPPEYETDGRLAARALAALDAAAVALDGGTGLVVTHGGVIVTLERHAGLDRVPIRNLEARWVEVTDAGLSMGERIYLLESPL